MSSCCRGDGGGGVCEMMWHIEFQSVQFMSVLHWIKLYENRINKNEFLINGRRCSLVVIRSFQLIFSFEIFVLSWVQYKIPLHSRKRTGDAEAVDLCVHLQDRHIHSICGPHSGNTQLTVPCVFTSARTDFGRVRYLSGDTFSPNCFL